MQQDWGNVIMQAIAVRLSSIRVLLVEDEPLIALDCESILRRTGVGQVFCATSMAEAEASILAGNFDVAILDVAIGGSNTLQLAQRMAALGTPVGFLSGYSQKDLPPAMQGAPFVAKPFSNQQLLVLLDELLRMMKPPL